MRDPPAVRTYVVTWIGLVALLAITFAVAHLRLGAWNTVANYSASLHHADHQR